MSDARRNFLGVTAFPRNKLTYLGSWIYNDKSYGSNYERLEHWELRYGSRLCKESKITLGGQRRW